MRQRNVVCAVLLVFVGSWVQVSAADEPSGSTPTLEGARPELTAGAEWLVWRTFHRSLEFYGRDFADDVTKLLAGRAGLTRSESAELLVAGKDYLDHLSRIDAEARQEIEVRFPPNIVDRRFVPTVPTERPPPAARHVPPAALMRKGGGEAPELYRKLVAEGFVARVEQQRQEALRAHLERLERAVGGKKVAGLRDWMSVDVAPNVKTLSRTTTAQR
jgi:hypothetical protein